MKVILPTIISCLFLSSCTSFKYPNWEMVRIESAKPSDKCVYKAQEVCDPKIFPTSCLNWHKQRATTYGANTVVVTATGSNEQWYRSSSGRVIGGQYQTSIADYYKCTK
jgi:hypothetical protein